MNTVRKHLSAIKGGRLAAAAAPARVITLAISDVPGDDPAVIGSGPTVPDPTTFAEARDLIRRYGISPSAAIMARLNQDEDETPKPGSLPNNSFRLIATPMMALRAAAGVAREIGLTPLILGDALEGEALQVGIVHAGIARSIRGHGEPIATPAVLLSGGETTVTLGGNATGRGGRNTTFLLGAALALNGAPGIWGLGRRYRRYRRYGRHRGRHPGSRHAGPSEGKGLRPRGLLAAHDSHGFFEAVGDAIRVGPTLTNVNDFRAILIA